jgi:hypothetical protein
MQTVTEPLRHEHRHVSDPLEAIRQAAEGVGDLSLPELRRQIDDVHAFLVERFIPQGRAEQPMVRDHAEVSRLAGKLLALRERLVYSYFGPAELGSLREVLYDLHGLTQLHLAEEDEFDLTLLDQ